MTVCSLLTARVEEPGATPATVMDQKQPLRPPRDRGVRPTAIRLGGSSRATSATSTNAAGTARSPRRHLSQSPTDPGLPDRPVVRPRCARGLQHRPNAHLSPRRGTVKARCPRPLRLCSKSSYIQQQNRDDIAVDPAVRARDLVLHGRPRSGAGRWLPPTTRTWPHRDRRSVRAPAAQVLFDRRCASSARTRTTRTTATQKGSPLSTSPASTASKHPK